MKGITQENLNRVIENHQHWIMQDCEGWEKMRAIFAGADLKGADFKRANLKGAIFARANLREANFMYANLNGANFEDTNLVDTNFTCADLREANFIDAVFNYANLTYTDLEKAWFIRTSLEGVNLRRANLTMADFAGANLRRANLESAVLKGAINLPFIPMVCPTEGNFIGWKKAFYKGQSVIIKLFIPKSAKRSSATTRKCRCDKVKVLSITSLDRSSQYERAYSIYDPDFCYKVGEKVSVSNFCEDRFEECAAGIHFFMSREEAEMY